MVRGGGVDLLVLAIAVLFLSLLVAGLVGLWVAAFARSIAEGALFSALAALLLLHASGIFRTPLTGSWGARVEGFSPYAALHDVLLTGVGTAPSGPTSMLVGNSGWSAALASAPGATSLLFVTAVLLAATWRLAGPLQRRLASSP